MTQEDIVCNFACEHAEFAKDAYCSDNITMYCKKAKTMVRKYSPCVLCKKAKTKKNK
jgi:predicted choloylglycine hydrolase